MPMPTLLPDIQWQTIFDAAWDYKTWREKGSAQVDTEFLATFPEEKHDGLRRYLKRNRDGMDETDTDFRLPGDVTAQLATIQRPVHIFAIAEDWCPDVIRHVPVLQKMADSSPNVTVRYLMRSDHLDIFARYLTTGGESVPKFIFLNQDFTECGSWGPMPDACRDLIARGRASANIKAAREQISAAYESDPDRKIVVQELLHQIDNASCATP